MQIRKEREDYSIADLRTKISRLEQALVAETKRRVDVTAKLQQESEEAIRKMEERLKNSFSEVQERTDERLNKLEERMQQLEERWTKESKDQLESVEVKGKEFQSQLQDLQSQVETERKSRLIREGQWLQQLETHAKTYKERWDKEREERTNAIATMTRSIQSLQTSHQDSHEKVKRQIDEELEKLQLALELETNERQAQDDEIVAALNRYTLKLQQSLSVLK